jgi:hypothetical protein
MKFKFATAAVAVLAACLFVSYANAGQDKPVMTKHTATAKEKKPKPPTVQEQIQGLRQEFQGEINGLKSDLASKDAELRQAKEAAAEAQAAADKANAAAASANQALGENAAAVTTLQSTVSDLKGNQASLAATVSDETSKIKKEIGSPDVLHYKGITLSPAGSFLAAETVWRSAAIGDDVNTHWTSIPLQYADNAFLSEFQGSGRQSRLALKATGKLDNMTLTGYYELDWLGAGVSSNNNQSNSYVMRQRQLWADAKLTNGWDFSGGQGWSLATETTKGLTRGTEILPGTIDAAYEPGFVWTRQYSFRVSKDFSNKFFAGIAAEEAETLNPGGSNYNYNFLYGTIGDTGGLYNSASNITFNEAPDMIAKIAVEPGWGHWELFGVSRFFRDRIYPGITCTSTSASITVGTTPTSGTPGGISCTGTQTGPAFNNSTVGGGVGGGFRGPLFDKKLVIGLKGLWGEGVGRYGDSTIADVTVRPNSTLAPLHGFSALSTVEINPTNRLNIYFNYGGDYLNREYWMTSSSTAVGYGIPWHVNGVAVSNAPAMSGCFLEQPPSGTNASTPAGLTGGQDPTAPSSCKANTKDVQEFTAGFWYNIYAGPKGRLRYGMQYSWARRDLWSGVGSTTAPVNGDVIGIANPNGGAYGVDNMVFTSLRYYLP